MNESISNLEEVIKPLVHSLRSLEKSHQLQVDLKLVELLYEYNNRAALIGQFDSAYLRKAFAVETQTLVVKRRGDQRSWTQYADAHGEHTAAQAFSTDDEVASMMREADESLASLKSAHPVLHRLYRELKGI